MRLRNKKTGGIDDFNIEATGLEWLGYTSLREFCEDWEDYEEPKEYWTISGAGFLWTTEHKSTQTIDELKRLGNLFQTTEEAEKAVEKLKAWKRLKDKGFKFSHHSFLDRRISYKVPVADEKIGKDLNLLFGGEE